MNIAVCMNVCVVVEASRSEEHLVSFNSTILKTLEYSLVATTLSHSQTDNIMRPILKVALNKSSIQKRLPRKLVYGTHTT